MRKSAYDFAAFYLLRRFACLCLFYDPAEILLLAVRTVDMPAAFNFGGACGSQTVFIFSFWGDYTVGRYQYRTVERLKLFFLFPPCVTVVSDKIVVFLEEGIVVSRQHLGVCIYVD